MTAVRAASRWAGLTMVVAALAGGCGGSPVTRAAGCPTTKPGGPRPPRYALLNFGDPIASASDPSLYGNGTLWVGLPQPNWAVRDSMTGMIGLKLGWFRARRGVVTVTGRPRDGSSARFSAQVGTPAEYGATGFAASDLEFGRGGCWQINARLAGRVLTVVLQVPRPSR